jgi:hypothetical protein
MKKEGKKYKKYGSEFHSKNLITKVHIKCYETGYIARMLYLFQAKNSPLFYRPDNSPEESDQSPIISP